MRLVAPNLLETATVLAAELDEDAAIALAEDARRRFPVGSTLGGCLGPSSDPQELEYLLDTEEYTVYIARSMAPEPQARSKRRYQHFCPAARALETVGEKWSLLIVRDLLAGPRRFSDLRRSLTAITPKWLSARLRALEADGVVAREATSRREVWYRLTPKGQALAPVIDALLVWGIDHALGRPRPGEAMHPGRAMDSVIRYLERRGVRPARSVAWVVRLGDDRSYTLRFYGQHWSRQRGEAGCEA